MKKYNIAQFGTFDLENFGDLLFPNVLEKNLKSRINVENLVLFSPVGGKKPFEDVEVYPIKQFDELNKKYNFDAIILGGGDLLRLDTTVTVEGKYNSDNPSYDLFVLPSIFADKYNIPLIYNAPGAPYPFENAQRSLVKAIAKSAVYFSVRDEKTAQYFREYISEDELPIVISPDSIVDIKSVYEKSELDKRFEKFCTDYAITDSSYIVFQNISAITDENLDVFARELDKISVNKKIVFMPINYVHDDTPVMRAIFDKMNTENKAFVTEHLSPFEMIALLCHCEGYIGSSLHGAVVSMAYGKKACALNLLNLSKLGGIFKYFGIENNLVTSAENISDVFESAVVLDDASLGGLVQKVSDHFDTLCDAIKGENGKYTAKSGFGAEIIDEYFSLVSQYAKDHAAPSVTVYFDNGTGFSESNTIHPKCLFDGEEFSLSIDIPADVRAIRFDPIESCGCILHDFKVMGKRTLEISSNGIDLGSSMVFGGTDPNIVISGFNGLDKLVLSFGFIPFYSDKDNGAWQEVYNCCADVNNDKKALANKLAHTTDLLDAHRISLAQKETEIELTQKHLANVEKILESTNQSLTIEKVEHAKTQFRLEEQLRATQEELLGILEDERKQFEKARNDYEARVLMLNTATNEMSAAIRSKDAHIAWQNSVLDATHNSFCWKCTAPIRGVSMLARKSLPGKLCISLKHNGVKGTIKKIKQRKENKQKLKEMSEDYTITDAVRAEQENTVFTKDMTFSVLVPLYNTPEDFLTEMIDSVRTQTYKKWQLCLADGSDAQHGYVEKIVKKYAKEDKRICYKRLKKNGGISENTNECIKMATGNYIALFDHDDLLHPCALFEVAKAIEEQNADFVYTDENKFRKIGQGFFDPHFKPDFAIDNLRANNYICHFTVFKASLIDIVGGFRKEFDGSQDHDLVLRLTEKAEKIVHIPKILYHWRVSDASVASDPYAKPYTITAGINAVSEHLERCGIKGTVESTTIHPNIYRIKYDIIGKPLISILIPTKDHIDDLKKCIDSICEKSTYDNFEIIIIENNSTETETFKYYEELKNAHKNLKVVVWEHGFNYSAINNFGAQYAKGDYILLLNNDVEVITPEWLEEMLMFAQRSDIGAVGSMLYYPDDTIQHAGVIMGLLTLAGHAFRNAPRGTPGYFGRAGFAQNLSCCTAACLMMPKKVFDEVDGLDETFEVAFNDVDLCMRIREKGYLIVFTPFCELYHYESKSRGLEDTPEKQKRFAGEVERFQKRWRKILDDGDPYYNPNLTLDREDFSYR